jgi:hypothetical protein
LKEVSDNVGVVDVLLALVDGRKRSSRRCRRSSRLREGRSHSNTVGSAVRSAVRSAERSTERSTRRSTARRADRSILDLASTSDALIDEGLVELLLHITSSTRHADINTSFCGIACVNAIGNPVAGNVDRLQVTTGIVDSTFDNVSSTALCDEDVLIGLRAGRASRSRLN